MGVCIGGRTTPPSSYLFPEYDLGNRNTTINNVFYLFFFVLRVTTKPSEEVDTTLPTSLVSLARDPRLVLREILCWKDKNVYTEHVKGEDSLYFCGLVYFLTYFFLFIGVPGSLRCQEKRTCRSQRLQPSRYFCLSIANMDSVVWGDPGPLISTAFPPHILTQILSYIAPEDRIRSLLNLIRLCGRTRRVNIRWVFNNFIYCT